jgi:hypothetical protein
LGKALKALKELKREEGPPLRVGGRDARLQTTQLSEGDWDGTSPPHPTFFIVRKNRREMDDF